MYIYIYIQVYTDVHSYTFSMSKIVIASIVYCLVIASIFSLEIREVSLANFLLSPHSGHILAASCLLLILVSTNIHVENHCHVLFLVVLQENRGFPHLSVRLSLGLKNNML